MKQAPVRARYIVVRERSDISDESVLRYCQTIRSGVIKALDMKGQGVPQGKHWLGALPPDYPPGSGRAGLPIETP